MADIRQFADERWKKDKEYEEVTLAEVRKEGKGYSLKRSDGWMLFIDDPGFKPAVGQTARFYGGGIGRPVRGVVINGKVVFYKTQAEHQKEEKARFEKHNAEKKVNEEKNREQNNASIASMPDVFQRRIARFRAGNPDFDWDHLPYELFTCEEAIKIATAFKDVHNPSKALELFSKLPYDQQLKAVPGLSEDHSGNTFGCAMRLAHWYLTNPENVVLEHGALVPLVGCKAYGCTHDS